MDTTTVAHPAPLTTTNLNARAERAFRLFAERGEEIQDLGQEIFEVPSCAGRGDLAALEERLAHELKDDDAERQELRDRVLRAQRSR